ncbi:MAG: hypothetical protein PUF37_00970 [Prevotellaceae bacterium]|nr:hypothetical protein [Prevotellaceae bacterium]
MRKILFLFFFSIVAVNMRANMYHSINIDKSTIATMKGIYSAELAEEAKNQKELNNVYGDYEKIGVSVAGIFVSKWFDRKALTNVRLFTVEEKMVYQRILYLLQQIMVRIPTVGVHFLRKPEKCLYWGPYLLSTTQSVENLAKQFQVLVTNNELTFDQIEFLVVNRDLVNLFEFAKNHQDKDYWKNLWKKIANIDDVKDDLGRTVKDDIKSIGGTLAQAGIETIEGNMRYGVDIAKQTSDTWKDVTNGGDWSAIGSAMTSGNILTSGYWTRLFGAAKAFHSKAKEVYDLYNTFKGEYDRFKDAKNIKDILLQVVDPEGTGNPMKMVYKLFQIDRYSTTEFMKDYLNEVEDQYYRQRWYIERVDDGKKVLYSDEVPDFAKKYGSEYNWSQHDDVLHYTSWGDIFGDLGPRKHQDLSKHYILTSSDIQKLKDLADNRSGWNSSKISQYESQNAGHNVTVEYSLSHQHSYIKYNTVNRFCFYGYGVTVTDTWSIHNLIEDQIFDSKTMDYDAFVSQMEAKLEEYQGQAMDQWESDTHKNNGIPPYPEPKFRLSHDDKIPYSETDAAKIKGSSLVTYKASCSDGNELVSGSFSWKVNPHTEDKHITAAAKDYAMQGQNTFEDDPLSQLNKKLESLNSEIASLEKKISALTDKINKLISDISTATLQGKDASVKSLKEQKEQLEAEKASLENQKAYDEQMTDSVQSGITECQEGILDDGDGNRIPSNLKYISGILNITWQPGVWVDGHNQYIYTCIGYCEMVKSDVTYTAVLTESRHAKKILGIRVHRPILNVDFSVTSGGTSDNIIKTMQLDTAMSDEAKAAKANEELHKLMDDYPNCKITMEMSNISASDSTRSNDPFHLLWADDRLAVAYKVEAELANINSQLYLIDYTMSLNESLTEYLKYRALDLVSRTGRSYIAQMALGRWQASADSAAIDQKYGTSVSERINNTEGK